MFNSLTGVISGKSQDTVCLLTGGCEWEIAMPVSDIEPLHTGSEYRIFTWLYHREDSMRLFGFSQEARRNTFLELIKVDGIGPKGALKIMGGISQNDLEQAIEADDLARLEDVPGLGTKTAQKILLSLKGKLVSQAFTPSESPANDLIQALVEMGYDKKSAQDALVRAGQSLPEGADAAEKEKLMFRKAIVFLSGTV